MQSVDEQALVNDVR